MEKHHYSNFRTLRLLITGLISMLILGLLMWQYAHGGVPSHHILHRKDLPAISNWWGGLLLPMLTWLLLGRIAHRLINQEPSIQPSKKQAIKLVSLFVLGLFFGSLLAISFTNDYTPFLDNVLYILLALSLIIPIYYSEFILGFVFGMTYTFGALLPTVFILIMATVGFLIYRFIRPLLLRATKVFSI